MAEQMSLADAVDWLRHRRGTWFGYTDTAIRRVLAELDAHDGQPADQVAAFPRYLAYGSAASRLASDDLRRTTP